MQPTAPKPELKPARPWFSSGPTAKPPGWSLASLSDALTGRSLRSPEGQARFTYAQTLTREVLQIPADHTVCFLPASDTGAVEAALWNLLGERPVQVLDYENFGRLWATDVRDHLKLDPEILSAPYGALPDLSRVGPDADLVFAWNGTTSGVKVPDADFIAPDREGLTICDATSAAFAMPLDWPRLDVVSFSFQKALGGDAGTGVLVLGPRAIARLDRFTPTRAIPKVLRLRNADGFDRALAQAVPINTYSLLVLEDWIVALEWARDIGGLDALIQRTRRNFETLSAWVERTPWIDFLAADPASRSETSVCLRFAGPRVDGLDATAQSALSKSFTRLLASEGAAFDLDPHKAAPPGLRIWCGATVETADIEALLPWLEWAWDTVAPSA